MNVFLLLSAMITSTIQSVFMKQYEKKYNGVMIFNAVSVFFALTVFLFTSGFRFEWNFLTSLYSIAFAVSYCLALLFLALAVKSGPLSITILIYSYSLLIPTLYGVLFLKETFKISMGIGIVLLLISIMLVNCRKDNVKINIKWFIYVIIAFIGNGCCSTIQKVQQIACVGKYKNELMIMACFIAVVILWICSLFFERDHMKQSVFHGWHFAMFSGLSNGFTNLCVLLLANRLPASVMFPIISAGGIVMAAMISVFFYKEKLHNIQWLGIIMGIASIVFLNL